MTQPKDIEGLRKVAEEAAEIAPGTWEHYYGGDVNCIHNCEGREIVHWSGFDASALTSKQARYDLAAFTAAASPDVVLALLSELEAVKGERDGWRRLCGDHQTAQDAAEAALVSLKEERGSSSVSLRAAPDGANETAETIVAAAMLHCVAASGDPRGVPVTISAPPPARHHNLFTTLGKPDEQGFLTSAGRFVGREEALRIAKASGQPMIDHPSRSDRQLFSEDLW